MENGKKEKQKKEKKKEKKENEKKRKIEERKKGKDKCNVPFFFYYVAFFDIFFLI